MSTIKQAFQFAPGFCDESGKPLKFYHCTNKSYHTFDDKCLGENTGRFNTELGHYFLDDQDLAAGFGQLTHGGRYIICAHLQVAKPVDLRLTGIFNRLDQASMIAQVAFGLELEPKQALEMLNDEIGLGEIEEVMEFLTSKEAREIYMAAGYDGAISRYGAGYDEYVVFRAEQVQVYATRLLRPSDVASAAERVKKAVADRFDSGREQSPSP